MGEAGVWYEYSPMPSGTSSRAAVQRWRALKVLDLKVWLKKMDSWSGAQRQNLSIVIYHTLFSHNEERFHQTGFKWEKKREKREVFTEDK